MTPGGRWGGPTDPPFAAPALCTHTLHTHADSPTCRRAPGPPPRVQPPGAPAPAGTVTAGHTQTHLPGAQALAHNTHGHSAQGPGAEGRCGGRGPGREPGRRRARGLMPRAVLLFSAHPPRAGARGSSGPSVKEGAGSARTAPLPSQRPARLARPAPAFPRPAASGKEFWGRPPSSSIPRMGRGVPAACGSASVSPPASPRGEGRVLACWSRAQVGGQGTVRRGTWGRWTNALPPPGGDVHPATPRAVLAGSLQLLQTLWSQPRTKSPNLLLSHAPRAGDLTSRSPGVPLMGEQCYLLRNGE
uniref:collagen alpha-2(I) chain-like n=1 Tax=Panthera onca TaxID=9690 RepID=UPI002952E2C1|nr:collagen alpha-2(I) chain-like [Panthera onca]XP_060463488.1 collagen alpha-2(I) chain-like [Panthera onca]